MRSYLDIVNDLKNKKEVTKEELGIALLFADDQLSLVNRDLDICLSDKYDKPGMKKLILLNRELMSKSKQREIDKCFEHFTYITK